MVHEWNHALELKQIINSPANRILLEFHCLQKDMDGI